MISAYSLQKISDLRAGDHLCCLYETEEEQRALLTAFLRQGLERGEKVLYIVDAHTAEGVLNRLQDDGLEVEPYLASGQLSVLTVVETYLPQGVFDPDGAIALWRGEAERALAEGYSALRLTEEMTWTLRELPGSERLVEYEVKFNELFPGTKCLTLCQYDRRRFAPEVLLDVLATHPIVIVGTEVYNNFYYIPTEDLSASNPALASLKRWLRNLEAGTRAEEALQESEERYRMLLNKANDAVFVYQPTAEGMPGKFIEVNDVACQNLGYTREELLNLSPLEVGVPALTEEFLAEEHIVEEWVQAAKGGRRVPVEISSHLFDLNGQPAVLSIARDITERRKAEEALRRLLGETARGQRLLLALSRATEAVQRARTSQEVYHTVGEEVAELGYQAVILTPTDDRAHLTISHLTFEPGQLRAAEELTGLSAEAFRFPLVSDGLFQRSIAEGESIFYESPVELIAEALPRAMRPLSSWLATVLGLKQTILAPLRISGETVGLLGVTGADLTEADLPVIAAFANQAAIAIENARLLDALTKHQRDLQTLSAQLINAQEAERKRISQELHNTLGQALTAIRINLATMERELPAGLAPLVRERMAEINSLADQVLEQVRELSLELRPIMLNDLGLVPTLRWYVNSYSKRVGIEVELEAVGFQERLPSEVETVLYRVFQEALTNVARHARAKKVRLLLERNDTKVCALIEDDGKGFDVEEVAARKPLERGVGLLAIRERVTSLGGSLSIQSRPGWGSRLSVEIPLQREGA